MWNWIINVNREVGIIWKEAAVAYFKALSHHLNEMKEVMKTLSKSSWSRSRNSEKTT
jgi:hypothetical protein